MRLIRFLVAAAVSACLGGVLCLAQALPAPGPPSDKEKKEAKPAQEKSARKGSAKKEDDSSAGKPSVPQEFKVGSGDQLHINVWNELAVTGDVVVRPDCRITVPLVKEMEVCGMTALEIQTAVTEKLGKFLTAPDVTVVVKQIVSRKIYLIGQVRRPGPMLLLSPMTIAQALSEAGGITEYANGKNILILRNQNGQQTRHTFNYKNFLKGGTGSDNIPLEPGDTIVVN